MTAVHDLPVEALVETPWWMEQADEPPVEPESRLARDPFAREGRTGVSGSVVTRTTARHPLNRRRLPSPPPVELQGIVTWGDGNVRAVVDGRQYEVGEVIKHRSRNWHVVGIDAEHRSVSIRWSDGADAVDATIYQRQDD